MPPGLPKGRKGAKFSEVFSKSANVNWLSAARVFLFGARDVWFVVGIPIYFYAVLSDGTPEGNRAAFFMVGTFMALWIILYGAVQALAPRLLRRGDDAGARPRGQARGWAWILAAIPAALTAAALASAEPQPWLTVTLVAGLLVFGAVFAVNSALHSYLILAFTKAERVTMDVGFYYMANAGGRLLGTVLSGLTYQLGGLPLMLGTATAHGRSLRARRRPPHRDRARGHSGMSVFERYLTLWVALAMLAGIAIGVMAPALVEAVAAAEVARVNLVVAVLIWAMVYPMMVGVDPRSLRDVVKQPKGLAITLAVNWLIKPFTMAALGVLFFEVVFADLIAPEDAQQYIAGLILLGAAPCTAMVFVWSQLTRGDESYTLLQVSVNDVVMVFAFAPIVAFLLGVTDIAVPWETLVLSVVLFVALPLLAGLGTRAHLGTSERIAAFRDRVKPWGVVGLIATVVILFGLQGQVILDRPQVIALIAVPILIQSYGIFALAYAAAWALRVPHRIAPCALIGTSNFFELAVAVAISLFGLNSGAALATVVGVLVEVPVMLSLVAFANRTRAGFT